jgi:hypothetical protein
LVESALADWFQRATNMGTVPLPGTPLPGRGTPP